MDATGWMRNPPAGAAARRCARRRCACVAPSCWSTRGRQGVCGGSVELGGGTGALADTPAVLSEEEEVVAVVVAAVWRRDAAAAAAAALPGVPR